MKRGNILSYQARVKMLRAELAGQEGLTNHRCARIKNGKKGKSFGLPFSCNNLSTELGHVLHLKFFYFCHDSVLEGVSVSIDHGEILVVRIDLVRCSLSHFGTWRDRGQAIF